MARASHDQSTLQAALYGYEVQKQKIDEKIREVQAQLRGKTPTAAEKKTPKARVKRAMSPAARARIAAAQKKRWAEFHKRKAATQKAGA
jgi:hypothetical protein